MYYTTNCPVCTKNRTLIEKLKNQILKLTHIAEKIASGERVSEIEAKRILAQVDGKPRHYVEYDE